MCKNAHNTTENTAFHKKQIRPLIERHMDQGRIQDDF